MSGDFLGGGIVFAIAAALWIAYLIPSWLRRKHFATTEATAVRMKHTVDAMAARGIDTSALVAAEATARAVHEQRKVLKKLEKQSRRSAREHATATLNPTQRLLLARHRRRNQRLGAFIFLLISLATVAAGFAVIVYLGDILVLTMGILMSLVALVLQRALGRPMRSAESTTVMRATRTAPATPRADVASGWTPQPLPSPLQATPDSASARTIARVQAAQARRSALVEQQYIDARIGVSRPSSDGGEAALLRADEPVEAPRSSRSEPRSLPETISSRFAALGILGEVDSEGFDLDQALRRRRAG